jgi:hypothetical protein
MYVFEQLFTFLKLVVSLQSIVMLSVIYAIISAECHI